MRIEPKVTLASLGSLVAGVVLAIIIAVQEDPSVIAGLPPVLQFVLIAAAPPLVTFLSGYAAPHTDRPDLPAGRHTIGREES